MNLSSSIIGILLALSAVCDAALVIGADEERNQETDMNAKMEENLSRLVSDAALVIGAQEKRNQETEMIVNMEENLSELISETVENKTSV